MKILKRRLLCAAVILGIAASICITAFNTVPTGSFKPRLSAPAYSDSMYYDDNIFYNSGFGMPNCTAYAWGRAYEILGEAPELCTGNAENWFEYNRVNRIYDYGFTPRPGAIACFSNDGCGHVAVVEDIENGVITFSNSAYGGSNFYLTTADINDENPGQDGWSFQGYIYLGNFSESKITLNSNRRVTAECGLNLRRNAGLDSEITDVIPLNSSVYISTVYEADGLFWGKTNYNGKTGYCVIDYTDI